MPRSLLRSALPFLLTHPVWDVTLMVITMIRGTVISTHTSRVGCDSIPLCLHSSGTFLLTHPVWDVTITGLNGLTFILFLLTHPVWDVTLGQSPAQPFLG